MTDPAASGPDSLLANHAAEGSDGHTSENNPDAQPRVLLLSGRFQVRGSCAYTLRLAEHLPAQGISVRVVCPHAGLVEPAKRARLAITEYAHFDAPVWGRLVLQRLLYEISQSVPD